MATGVARYVEGRAEPEPGTGIREAIEAAASPAEAADPIMAKLQAAASAGRQTP
jgi:hypothetical protein